MSWPWSQLGLSGPSDLSQVRHAYAEKLKSTHPEEDPEGFQRLHSAYQLASCMARQQKRRGTTPSAAPTERQSQDRLVEQLGQPTQEQAITRPPQKRDEGEIDFDRLFQEGSGVSRPRQEEREQDFDFDQLLREEKVPPRPPEEVQQDFDFDRLFAEGEAERVEARRRRGRERRNIYEQEQQVQFHQEQVWWQSTEAILHTIETMYHAGARENEWEKFFLGPVFQQNKGNIDLIFGLEDFVSLHQDLPQKVKIALYLAYSFDKGVSRPELRPLYQMLLPARQAEQGEKRRQWIHNIWGGVGGVVGVFVLVTILTSSYLIVFLILGALLLIGLKKGWFARTPKKLNRKSRLIKVFAVALGLACIFAVVLWGISDGSPDASVSGGNELDPREQVCQYMEEDFGVPFYFRQRESAATDFSDNIFSPESEPNKMFLAGPDAERSTQEGKRGYTTNYPDMMVRWAISDFAKSWDLKNEDVNYVSNDQGMERWETSGVYLIVLPFYGGGDLISALGELLEKLPQEDWYQLQPPKFEVVLCSDELEAGRLILYQYQSSDGSFDAESIRELYESAFAHSYCAQIIQECELDRDFTSYDHTEIYTLTNGGMAELKGLNCCRLYGLDEKGQTAMEYYINVEKARVSTIYCVPGGYWEEGGREDALEDRLIIDRKNRLGTLMVQYPWGPETW